MRRPRHFPFYVLSFATGGISRTYGTIRAARSAARRDGAAAILTIRDGADMQAVSRTAVAQ
jgi:hypothetical protein